MAEAANCDVDPTRSCPAEEQQQQLEVEEPSILPETAAGPVEAGPLPAIQLRSAHGYPNFRVLGQAAPAAMAAQEVDTRVQGYVEPDDSLLNVSEYTSRQVNPLLVSFGIMDFVEQGIKGTLFDTFDQMFHELHVALSNDVPDPSGAAKGFVGITKCGFLSKYTTVIYYAGRIPFDKNTIFHWMTKWYPTVGQTVKQWNTATGLTTETVEFTCKFERSPLQYDTQKIILCIKLKSSGNIIQIPILNVVGFPVFQDVNPLLQQLGCISPQSLPCFVDKILPGQTLSLLDIIVRVRLCANQGAITALSEPSKEEVTLILHCFQGIIPEAIVTAQAHQQAAMAAFGRGIITEFVNNQNAALEAQQRAYKQQEHIVAAAAAAALASGDAATVTHYQAIMGYQQTAINNQQAAIDAFKRGSNPAIAQYLHIVADAQQNFVKQQIAYHAATITRNIHDTLYNTDANIKPFALFCNIFYNFINVSFEYRSLAKIIYSEFFGASDNYGKVIRACQVVNRLPIMNEHVKFFLTGSNAARVYLALNDIIKLGAAINPETIAPILKKTFGNLSDNDFMIYLNREVDEPYRVFIRMILGGSFYFFKDLFDPGTLAKFTETMIQSVGIVGYMDHLFAQRFDARPEFLFECYQKDTTSFLTTILTSMDVASMKAYFVNLDKQINVAHLDGVFKYYTLEKFYKSILSICNSIPFDRTNLNIDALNASFAILQGVIHHIITTQAIIQDQSKSDTINVLFTKFSQFYTTRFIPQLTTDIDSLPRETLIFFPTDELLISLDNLIMLLDEIIKYMTKHNINYVYRENTDDKGSIISRQTAIELIQTLLGIFEGFKNSASLNIALDFLINKATSIDCIATVWTLVLNVLYTLFVPENCLARIAVGKFDNDPKNLKLYMEILNAHLTDLHEMGYTHLAIPELHGLQTRIATMCQTSITTGAQLQSNFKQACDTWVRKMVEMAASGPAGQGLFMLSESDAREIRQGRSTKLERALCLAYLPTSRGNICSAASPSGPHIFREQILKIVDLETNYITSILSSTTAITLVGTETCKQLFEQLKANRVNDGNLYYFLTNPVILLNLPFSIPQNLVDFLIKLFSAAPKKTLNILSSTTAITLVGTETCKQLFEQLKANGVNDGNLNDLLTNPVILLNPPFSIPPNLVDFLIKLFSAAPKKTLNILSSSDAITLVGTETCKQLFERLTANGVNDGNLNDLLTNPIILLNLPFSIPPNLVDFLIKLFLAATRKPLISILGQEPPISGSMDQFEIDLHEKLTTMGSRFEVCFRDIGGTQITIQPENTALPLSTYLNFMWKHITTSAIDLKIFFKENLTDIKRVTGIKYIALILGGYFQIRLLVDDVHEQCPDPVKLVELESFKTSSREMMACKRGLLPLLIDPNLIALIKAIIQMDRQTGTNYGDPVPIILKILGFLFSIKVKSSSPHSPYQLLRLVDSMLRFKIDSAVNPAVVPFTTEILRPTEVMFIQFLKQLDVPDAFIKCICSSKYKNKEEVKNLDLTTLTELNPGRLFLYDAVGGSNDSYSNRVKKLVTDLNKYKYKHNKLARNNRTHRNKNKRKKNSKSKSYKPKPKSKSHKSKSGKSRRKNVTFKRRKRSNRH